MNEPDNETVNPEAQPQTTKESVRAATILVGSAPMDAAEAAVREVMDQLSDLLEDLRFNASKIAEHGARADGIVRSMLQHSRGDRTVPVIVEGAKVIIGYNGEG